MNGNANYDYVPDQHLDDGLFTFVVILENEVNLWEYFVCEAETADHAEEQAVDAEPDAKILWVNRGLNFSMENVYDVTITASVTKTIRVNASDEDEAVEQAHDVFSVLNDDPRERYDEQTDHVKLVDFDNGDT